MEQRLLNANERSTYGKSAAVKMRKAGRIPAVMYDRHGKSVSLDVDEREFMKLFKLVTESTIVTLNASGKDYEVFIKDFQHDIVTDKIKHVDFYDVNQSLHVRDIKLPEAVTVLTSDDITVAAVKFAAAESTTPAATEGEEAEAAAAEPAAEAK